MKPGEPCGPMGLPASYNRNYEIQKSPRRGSQRGVSKRTMSKRGEGKLTEIGPRSCPKRKPKKAGQLSLALPDRVG